MDIVRGWAGALCVVAVGCTLVQMLVPKDGTGRIFRILIAAFFLCCLVSPLLKLGSILDLDLEILPEEIQSEMLMDKVNEQLEGQISAAVEKIAGEALENYNLSAEKIETITDTSENGSIYIKQIILVLDKQKIGQATTVRQVLEERLGAPVDVQAAG